MFTDTDLDDAEARHDAGQYLQPVDFSNVDFSFVEERLDVACRFAASLLKGDGVTLDAGVLRKLTLAAAQMLDDPAATDGLQLDTLADRAEVGRGRMDTHLKGDLLVAVDLAARALFFLDRRRVFFEELYGIPAKARRDSKRGADDEPGRRVLGFEQRRQSSSTLRLVGFALAGSERHLASNEIVLTTGTHHDWSSERASEADLAHFTALLGERPAGPLDEHVTILLRIEDRARKLVLRAMRDNPDAFALLGTSGDRFATAAFTDLVVVAGLPVGPPQGRRQRFERVVSAGDDQEVLRRLTAAGRTGVALRTVGPALKTATSAKLEAAGWSRVTVPTTDYHRLLGVDHPVFGREWWHSTETHRLLRKLTVRGPEGMAITVQEWQLFGKHQDNLVMATALVERSHQPWPAECLATAVEQCAPGFLHARRPDQQAGTRAILRLARCAAVSGDRESRRPGGRRSQD